MLVQQHQFIFVTIDCVAALKKNHVNHVNNVNKKQLVRGAQHRINSTTTLQTKEKEKRVYLAWFFFGNIY